MKKQPHNEKMAKYNKEKNLVSTEFLADEKKVATGLNGPAEILNTILEILKMFNPDALHNDGETSGGITSDNIREKSISEKCLSEEFNNKIFLIQQNISALSDLNANNEENISKNSNLISLLDEMHIKDFETLESLITENTNKINEIHTHENKEALDSITAELIEKISTNEENISKNAEAIVKLDDMHCEDHEMVFALITENTNKINEIHTHENKEALDSITAELIEKISTNEENISKNAEAIVKLDDMHCEDNEMFLALITENTNKINEIHTHENKEALDGITAEQLAEIHTHENADVLSQITDEMIEKINSFDYSKANSLAYFFASNHNNSLYGNIDTSGALIADYIFKNNSMTDILVNLSSCVSLTGGFLNSEVENVTFVNETPKLKKAQNLFSGCKGLKTVTGLELASVESCKYMFHSCESIEEITAGLTLNGDCSYMLYGCSALTSVTLDCTNVTNATGMLTGCTSVTSLVLNGITVSFDVSDTAINEASDLFNSLGETTGGVVTFADNTVLGVSESAYEAFYDKGWTCAGDVFFNIDGNGSMSGGSEYIPPTIEI